jgi:hypothetical protein
VAWTLGVLVTVRTVVQSYCQVHLAILKSLDRTAAIGPIQAIHFAALLVGIATTCRYACSFNALLGWLIGGQLL